MTPLSFHLVSLICLMVATHAAAQIIITDSLRQEGKTVQGNREGAWKFYAPLSGTLQIEGSYRKGKPDGKWFWYSGSRVFYEQSYRKGSAEGWGRWYQAGKLVREQWFSNGSADSAFAYYNPAGHYALRGMTNKARPRGIWQVYFPDGKLAAEWHWFKRGGYHGESRWYYPNGKLLAKGHFLTGLAEGRWEFYAADNSWKITGNFKDNEPHGIWEISVHDKILHRLSLKSGNLQGLHFLYNYDGKIFQKIMYDSGKLMRLEEQGKVLIDSGAGERIFRDLQGAITAKGTYRGGFLEGNVQYFSNLQEILTQNYRKGQPDGTFELRTVEGGLLMRGTYRVGALDSLCSFFYPDKKLQAQGMLRGGLETGSWQFFHPNGNLRAVGAYQNGIPDGQWTYYDEQGQVVATGALRGGCKYGEWTFYANGSITAKGYFEDGLKNGTWTDYYLNGKIRAQGSYAYDREHGEWRYFHSNGQARQTEQWQAGKLMEISDFITTNGRPLPKGNFKKGNGSRLIYHEKRHFLAKWQVSVSGNYKDGLPEGRWRYYDRKGRLRKELIFVQGKPQSDD